MTDARRTGLYAMQDAAQEYVCALEARRLARIDREDAAIAWDDRAKSTPEERIAEMNTTGAYRQACRRVTKALARIERLLAIMPRVQKRGEA